MVPVMTIHHPWRRLRERPDIVVDWGHLPEDVRALTDGVRRIWMDRELLQVERRCSIDHELAHVELGHVCGADLGQERTASLLSARRLIPVDALVDAARWSVRSDEVADALWVTQAVLRVRMEHLLVGEQEQLIRATAHHRGE